MNLRNVTNLLGITSSTPQQNTPVYEPDFDPEKLGPKEVYLTWSTLSRSAKKTPDKKVAKTLIVIGAVVGLLLAIMGEIFLIMVIGSLIFIGYALSSTPPDHLTYEISSHGIMLGDVMYYWHQTKNYFVSQSAGENIVAINTVQAIPGRVYVSVTPENKERVLELLSGKLHFLKEEPKTFMDKAYTSFVDKFDF